MSIVRNFSRISAQKDYLNYCVNSVNLLQDFRAERLLKLLCRLYETSQGFPRRKTAQIIVSIVRNFSGISVQKDYSNYCVNSMKRLPVMFIHVKTSENWFFSIVKGFRANFDKKI